MKLHDLRPADGSRTERTRVGRGIAAGKGKTRAVARRARRLEPAARSRRGSKAARRRSTSGSPSSEVSATAAR